MQHVITNARIVTASESFIGSIVFDKGHITRFDSGLTSVPAAEDWEGDFMIAGLVELHTDNLEKHLVPRPAVVPATRRSSRTWRRRRASCPNCARSMWRNREWHSRRRARRA